MDKQIHSLNEKKEVIVASLQKKLKRHELREGALLMEKKKKREVPMQISCPTNLF